MGSTIMVSEQDRIEKLRELVDLLGSADLTLGEAVSLRSRVLELTAWGGREDQSATSPGDRPSPGRPIDCRHCAA